MTLPKGFLQYLSKALGCDQNCTNGSSRRMQMHFNKRKHKTHQRKPKWVMRPDGSIYKERWGRTWWKSKYRYSKDSSRRCPKAKPKHPDDAKSMVVVAEDEDEFFYDPFDFDVPRGL